MCHFRIPYIDGFLKTTLASPKIICLDFSLRENCPNMEFFLVRIWTIFTYCLVHYVQNVIFQLNKLIEFISDIFSIFVQDWAIIKPFANSYCIN